jgi:signal transduction histidine kinase
VVLGIVPKRERAPSTPARRVWFLSLGIASVAALVQWRLIGDVAPLVGVPRVPWWALAIGFALAEAVVVHLQFRREAHSFSLNEIPLVIAMFTVSPAGLVLAQLVGAAVSLGLRRRQPLMKLVFNLAQLALGAQVALLVFRAVGGAGAGLGPLRWLGALLGVLVATIVGAIAVSAAIYLTEGRREREVFPKATFVALGVGLGTGAVGLLAVELLAREPVALWLLVIPVALVQLIYREYTAALQRHASLQVLYEATRTAQESIRIEETMVGLLERARDMFRAQIGEIVFFADEEAGATRTTVDPRGAVALEPVELDPSSGVWARVASEGQSVLLARPIQGERLQEHFGARGIRDAMVAPLVADHRIVGTMTVANRNGDVTTFGEGDLQLFETLANHASVALENARLVRRLEDSLEHLTEMNRLKDDFVATVSHELRTPLTAVQGTIKTLLRANGRLDVPTEASLLEAADRQSDRLRQLIENLLIVGRIESHQVATTVTSVSIPKVVQRVGEEIVGHGGPERLGVVLDDALPIVETDEGKLHQVLLNLVENALKYSPDGRPVTVRAVPRAEGVVVSVEDRGSGIPADVRDRVFDRFFQVDQTSTRPAGGTGLGLYICKQLADALQGRLWLERSDANGSVFSLWLPLRPVTAEAEEPVKLPA